MSHVRLWWRTVWLGPTILLAALIGLVQHWIPAQLLAPQLRALQDTVIPSATLVSAVIGMAAAYQTVEPQVLVWRLAPRSARLRGCVRAGLVLAAYLSSTALFSGSWGLTAANACLTGAAETAVLLRLTDRRVAWALPSLHAACSALLGRQLFGGLSWWAWPADPTPGVPVVGLAGLVLLVALVVPALRD